MNYNTKPLILIFPFGLLSHYLRCIVLADRLKENFTLQFAAHPDYSSFVEEGGYSTFECSYISGSEAISGIKNFDFSWLNDFNLENTFLSQVKAIEELKPVAVIGDSIPTLKMAAEYRGVQHVALMNSYMTRYYDGCRSLPKKHPVQKFVKLLPEHLQEFLTINGEAIAFKKIHKPFRSIRNRYGLRKVTAYLEETEGDLNLICDLPHLFPQKHLPENFRFIGPLIYKGKNRTAIPNITIEQLKRTIYVTMGSSGNFNDLTFLNDTYYNMYNIVCTGDSKRVLDAPHIQHADFINADDIFPVSDLVICHGGNGTIYQALFYKIPVLCMPSHFEQEWNANVLEKNQLGRCIDDITNTEDIKIIIAKWIKNKQLPLWDKTESLLIDILKKQKEAVKFVTGNITQDQSNPVFTETRI